MLVYDFEIIITKPFPASLMLSPFGFYGDILELVYTTSPCGAMVRARSRKPAIEDSHVTSDGHVTSWYTPYWRSSHQCQAISEMRIIHVDMCVKRLG